MINKKTKPQQSDLFYNILIGVLSILVVGFVYSFAKKSWSKGVYIQDPNIALNTSSDEQSAVEIYEANPILDIKVEILNGMGEKGIAAKTADYLRTQNIDVIRWENADNFNYKNTTLIQRSNDTLHLATVAKALGFDSNAKEHIIFQPNESADVDLTLIIGKDYNSVKPLNTYLANQIQNIKVEILNGCGVKKIAHKVADFLSSDQIEVVRSENADNFKYTKTVLLARSDNKTTLDIVNRALKFDSTNQDRVKLQPKSNSDVDYTLILGSDYNSINSISSYLSNLNH